MKIRVEKKKIVQALKKLEGIEIVLEGEDDAREALDLVMGREDTFSGPEFQALSEVRVSEAREYKTSAVEYQISYLMDFVFHEGTAPQQKAEIIKKVQSFFEGL